MIQFCYDTVQYDMIQYNGISIIIQHDIHHYLCRKSFYFYTSGTHLVTKKFHKCFCLAKKNLHHTMFCTHLVIFSAVKTPSSRFSRCRLLLSSACLLSQSSKPPTGSVCCQEELSTVCFLFVANISLKS